MRTPEEDSEVLDLLRSFDRVTARLFELGVNPYQRCTCAWTDPHAVSCPKANGQWLTSTQRIRQMDHDPNIREAQRWLATHPPGAALPERFTKDM